MIFTKGLTESHTQENIHILNLTPHAVTVIISEQEKYTFEPQEISARCTQKDIIVGKIAMFNITATEFGEVENLPEEKPNTYYIVSRLVLNACAGKRHDLLVPNQLIRDSEGQIVGCRSFSIQ